MDNETRKRVADRDADEALDAILREIDLDERRKTSDGEKRRSSHSDSERRSSETRRSADAARSRSQQSRPVSHAKESARSETNAERPSQRSAQLHRLPAAAERPEERSQRLAAERARNTERSGERPVRRQPADRMERQQRPAERAQRLAERTQRPAERTQRSVERTQRMPERTQRPVERPQRKAPAAESAAKPTAAKRPAKNHSGSRSATAPRKSSAFAIGMILYVIIFLLIIMFMMHRLNLWLGEYEASQPQYTIDGYVASLNSGFYTDMVRQHVDQIPVSAYETADSIAESLDIENIEAGKYTWSKNVVEFTEEKPVYYIRSGNAAIATVELKRVGGTEHYDFPIWQTCPAKSLIEVATEPQYSLEVIVPDGASVMINGIAMPFEDMEKGDQGLVLDDVAKMYAQQPQSLHASIDGLYAAPKVQAYDSLGNILTPIKVPDSTEAKQVFQFEPKAESAPDAALVSRVEAMMRAYIDYMANKDEALWTNLGVLDNYLVPNSSAYKKLHSITQDINWNNPYTARLDRALDVSNVRMYSENVCTVEVHYDYQLTKNVVNDYVGDMRWTFIKTGAGWSASEFEITGSNDTKFEDESNSTDEPVV